MNFEWNRKGERVVCCDVFADVAVRFVAGFVTLVVLMLR